MPLLVRCLGRKSKSGVPSLTDEVLILELFDHKPLADFVMIASQRCIVAPMYIRRNAHLHTFGSLCDTAA